MLPAEIKQPPPPKKKKNRGDTRHLPDGSVSALAEKREENVEMELKKWGGGWLWGWGWGINGWDNCMVEWTENQPQSLRDTFEHL